jgi:DNA-binding response OmpR family regulator
MTSTSAPVQQDRSPLSILLYSNDPDIRDAVRLAVGSRPAPDLPEIEWEEYATRPAVIEAADGGGFDLMILDGEATPAGGLGLCKQLKDELDTPPTVLVLTGRQQDAWLAAWSRAEVALPRPLDPVALAETVVELCRRSRTGEE